MPEFKTRAISMIDALRMGVISVQDFCEKYENLWNFERASGELDEQQAVLFEGLFDVVAAYSPFPEERERITRYKSEDDVVRKAAEVRAELE